MCSPSSGTATPRSSRSTGASSARSSPRHGGVEVDTQGDSFFVAFPSASGALTAAAAAQRALADSVLQARIGVHTGEPQLTDEGYVGLDVHRAARICAAGHGGQILLSQATRELVDVEVLDLGSHRLKDLGEPVRLFQLGAGDFPPLRSLNRTNLPVQPTPFLGREAELEAVLALLRDGTRLLTLTGPGGTGKTRLAVQAAAELAHDFPDGVVLVPLAPVRDPELVLPTIEQTIGASDPLSEYLRNRSTLLVLDNFEQVAEAAVTLADVLAASPGTRLLVTSRAPLHLEGEQEFPVPPLPDPHAVQLFVDRARSVRPDFRPSRAVLEICRRLDNLPLAIELAAARVRVLETESIVDRLDRRLHLLTGGARDRPERQQTLRAAIEWSYDLLESVERDAFALLAVFCGGWTAEAAEHSCNISLDLLESPRREQPRPVRVGAVRDAGDDPRVRRGDPRGPGMRRRRGGAMRSTTSPSPRRPSPSSRDRASRSGWSDWTPTTTTFAPRSAGRCPRTRSRSPFASALPCGGSGRFATTSSRPAGGSSACSPAGRRCRPVSRRACWPRRAGTRSSVTTSMRRVSCSPRASRSSARWVTIGARPARSWSSRGSRIQSSARNSRRRRSSWPGRPATHGDRLCAPPPRRDPPGSGRLRRRARASGGEPGDLAAVRGPCLLGVHDAQPRRPRARPGTARTRTRALRRGARGGSQLRGARADRGVPRRSRGRGCVAGRGRAGGTVVGRGRRDRGRARRADGPGRAAPLRAARLPAGGSPPGARRRRARAGADQAVEYALAPAG